MTETEENQLLVEAEIRRREKAAEWQKNNPPAKTAGDTLEEALGRLQSLKNIPPQTDPGRTSADHQAKIVLAGVPLRHQKIPAKTESPWQCKLDETTQRIGDGFLIAIAGTQGTGKTQFGAALIAFAISKHRWAKYACAMDFFISLKASFDDGSKATESGVLNAFIKPQLLVLDEMDERSESAWENRLLFHMLNQRYNAMLDTLLISRRTKAEFVASLGASIQSRIQETGGSLTFNWPSFRS